MMRTQNWNHFSFTLQSEVHFNKLKYLYTLLKTIEGIKGAPNLDLFKEIEILQTNPTSLPEQPEIFCIKLQNILFFAWGYLLTHHQGDLTLIKSILFDYGSKYIQKFNVSLTVKDAFLIMQTGPFFNYPEKNNLLIKRSLQNFIIFEHLSCPHKRSDIFTQANADLICDFESYWIRGIFSGFDKKVEIHTSQCTFQVSLKSTNQMRLV